jgi:hypothetical protein
MVTSIAFVFSPWSIISVYSVLNDNKIEENNTDNYKQLSIYREQFEVGYTIHIKQILNYLLHLSHEELLVSLTFISTLLSIIFIYYLCKCIKSCCSKRKNEIFICN